MIKILVGGGGFHNVSPVEISVPDEDYLDAATIESRYANPWMHATEEAWISGDQLNIAARNMCGMADCVCGSTISITLMDGDRFLVPCEKIQ